jgi:sugar phosphate isomerase/epimerase
MASAACLVIHPGTRCAVGTGEETRRLERLNLSLDTLIQAAETAGVALALENMLPDHVGCSSATLRRVVEGFDSPFLGICLDTGHAHLSEEGLAETFATLRDRIITFHLQDNDGHADRHLQPPYGTIDWASFAGQFRRMDFPHPVAIEAPPWNGASWDLQLREMRALFAGQTLTVRVGGRDVWAVCPRCRHLYFGTVEEPFCGCR